MIATVWILPPHLTFLDTILLMFPDVGLQYNSDLFAHNASYMTQCVLLFRHKYLIFVEELGIDVRELEGSRTP